MDRLMKQARSSGSLNLSNRSLREVPNEVYKNLEAVGEDEKWWEFLQGVELQKLILAHNELEVLREDVKNLTMLSILNISHNKLSSLPAAVGELSLLKSLDVSFNSLTCIPEDIGSLTSLVKLDCSNNLLNELPHSLGNCIDLLELKATNNSIAKLPDELAKCLKLIKVDIEGNKLTVIPEIILRCWTLLTEFNAARNLLATFPDSIGVLTKLIRLDFHQNKILLIPSSIMGCCSLAEFYMGTNLLSSLPEELGALSRLGTLDLHSNQLKEFPVEACKLQLSVLDLSNNSLSSLPPEIGNMTSLRKLLLNGNPIRTIRSSLVSGPTLALLKYLRSRLSSSAEAPGSSSSPIKVDIIAKATRLSLSSKELSLSGLGLTTVPSTVWETDEVVKVDLSRNSITGLPNEMTTCSSLQLFRLRRGWPPPWGFAFLALPLSLSFTFAGMAVNRHVDPDFLVGSTMSRSFVEALSGSSSSSSFPDLKPSFFRGFPALLVSEEEFFALAEPFRFSLVGFFPSKCPSLESIRKFFVNLKLNGVFSVTLLDRAHVLIKLENDLNYSRVFCHRSYLVFNCFMRLTKWSPSDDIDAESPIVPVWISFPNLRPHFYSPRILHGLGLLFGKPLKVDNATAVGLRPSVARVLVEIDVSKKYFDKIWFGPEKLGNSCRPPVGNVVPIVLGENVVSDNQLGRDNGPQTLDFDVDTSGGNIVIVLREGVNIEVSPNVLLSNAIGPVAATGLFEDDVGEPIAGRCAKVAAVDPVPSIFSDLLGSGCDQCEADMGGAAACVSAVEVLPSAYSDVLVAGGLDQGKTLAGGAVAPEGGAAAPEENIVPGTMITWPLSEGDEPLSKSIDDPVFSVPITLVPREVLQFHLSKESEVLHDERILVDSADDESFYEEDLDSLDNFDLSILQIVDAGSSKKFALANLEILDLSGNASSLLDSSAFPLLPQLKELHLRRMKLSHIPPSILSLQQLRVLDLSQNLLVSLPEDIRNLTCLQELDLSNNNIAALPSELGLLESHLQVLKLDGNPLRSIRRPVLDRGTKAILKYLKDKLPEQ
ncbi:hypothetical protein M5K25_010239 [Dendrobium thyrsiflorum]|uniref:DUF4283 domain-containing protein n=1 Tax=Dendrobium thyrsiflorum TaxID=117978 RepID=A0ABD0V043_DENTH